jgi:hypothetical protein
MERDKHVERDDGAADCGPGPDRHPAQQQPGFASGRLKRLGAGRDIDDLRRVLGPELYFEQPVRDRLLRKRRLLRYLLQRGLRGL